MWLRSISFNLLLTVLPILATAGSPGPTLSTSEKAARLRAAILIAHERVRAALANSAYVSEARPSIERSGPRDTRAVLEKFLERIPDDPARAPLIFDGGGLTKQACPRGVERFGAVRTGGTEIYICDTAFAHSDEEIAEALIHEFTHTLGYNGGVVNECIATEVEFSAFIASGRAPYGNDYSRDKPECQRMTAAMAKLSQKIWPPEERVSALGPGRKLYFSADLLAQIEKQTESMGNFMMLKGPSGQTIEIDPPDRTKMVPHPPLTITQNVSKDGDVAVKFTDAKGVTFDLAAMGPSQVPLPLSMFTELGITFGD